MFKIVGGTRKHYHDTKTARHQDLEGMTDTLKTETIDKLGQSLLLCILYNKFLLLKLLKLMSHLHGTVNGAPIKGQLRSPGPDRQPAASTCTVCWT